MDDDAMDGSTVKRRGVKELTKQGGKRDGTTKRAKKSMVATSPKKSHLKAEKKQKKLEKQTKKDMKKITKSLGKLQANDGVQAKAKSKKKSESMQTGAEKLGSSDIERLIDAWGSAMKELAEMPTTSDFHKEILKKCEGQVVPRNPKSAFMEWIEQNLGYSRETCYSKLKVLYKKIKRVYDTRKPRTKTEKRRLEKKRSRVRKQMLAQAAKAEQPPDEQTLQKKRMKQMKKKEKLKKRKFETLLKKKSGLKIKDSTPLSEEQKDVVMKELKKKKKDKKKAKSLGI